MQKIKVHAFCDGSKKDLERLDALIRARRAAQTGNQVCDRIIWYLEELAEVIEADMKRHKKAGDEIRLAHAKERYAWLENMVLWINQNV